MEDYLALSEESLLVMKEYGIASHETQSEIATLEASKQKLQQRYLELVATDAEACAVYRHSNMRDLPCR
jgi:hypothetical protein